MSNQSIPLLARVKIALNQDGGRAVFRHYGFTPQRKAQKINPFRDERTSSFYVTDKFDKVIFKDFGEDTYKGDAWRFVELYEQVSRGQAVQIIAQIYGLADFGWNSPQTSHKKIKETKKQSKSFEKKLLDIQFKEFSSEELNFWKKKGAINLETLQANRVKSVSSFQIETQPEQTRDFVNLKFVFAYEIVPKQVYKLYMPKKAYRVYAQAKTVFLPNLDPARREIDPNYTYSFGLETLEMTKPVIICAGEPDCLALKTAGYNAFTLGDERSTLPDYILERLGWEKKDLSQKLKVLYDTDYTGLQNSKKLAQTHKAQRLLLPKLHQQKNRKQPKPKQNDLCDYLGQYGWDESLKLCLQQNIFKNKDYVLANIPTLPVKKYLSEQSRLLAHFLQEHKKIQIQANAGTGKTYTLLSEISGRLKQAMLFVVPFAIQVEQIEKEYGEKIKNLTCLTNAQIHNSSEAQEIFGLPVNQVTVCTYDRIQPVYKRMQEEYGEKITIVVDESHLLTSEYAYRTYAIHQVLDTCNLAEKVVFLSATPDYAYCNFHQFRLIRFEREKNPLVEIQPLNYAGSAKKALLSLLSNQTYFPRERKSLCVVRLNNKVLAKAIARTLIEGGFYQKEEIDFVFSEKRVGASTLAKKNIVNESLIPRKIKLLFVTACFDCGINILNQNIDKIISFESNYTDNCLDTARQFLARFRRLDEVRLWVCKPINYLDLPQIKPKLRLYSRLKQDAQNKLALLNYTDKPFLQSLNHQIQQIEYKGLNTSRTPGYIKQNPDISAIHKLIRKTDNTYSINYNYIRFALKEYERKNLSSGQFYENFAQLTPKCVLRDHINLETLLDPISQENLKTALQQEKEHKETLLERCCEVLKRKPEEFFNSVYHAFRDLGLRKKIKKNYILNPASQTPDLENILEVDDLKGQEELISQAAHRFFYLKDLLIPEHKIPGLLKVYSSESKYKELSKTISNHILLKTLKKQTHSSVQLINDVRKQEDGEWLQLFIENITKLKNKVYVQKKTQSLQKKLNHLNYDLKILRYQNRNYQNQLADLDIKIQGGEKLKSTYRDIQRKSKTLENRIKKLEKKTQTIQNQIDHSQIKGWGLHELSELINHLRPHQTDWQGSRTNLRLLSSLFQIQIHKRHVLYPNDRGQKVYQEKTLVEIGKHLSFEEVLQRIGFSKQETQNYLEFLDYQLELDIKNSLDFSAKNPQKSDKRTIVNNSSSQKTDLTNLNNYPASWDI